MTTQRSRRIISFAHGGACFNFRAAAIIIDRDRVLLHHAEFEDFWTLPGGRVEMLEGAEQALRREMQEEIGEDVSIGRLVWVAENFFEFQGTPYHELGLYFRVSLPEGSSVAQRDKPWETYEDNGVKLIFEWFGVQALKGLTINPSFLAKGLVAPPVGTGHVVERDYDSPIAEGSDA